MEDGIHQQHGLMMTGGGGGRDGGGGQKMCISPLASVPKTWRFHPDPEHTLSCAEVVPPISITKCSDLYTTLNFRTGEFLGLDILPFFHCYYHISLFQFNSN